MIRVLAIDDEPLALQQIVAYISKTPFLQLAAQCQSALEAREYMEHDTVDAIFCDINMPDLNGMDFVKSLAVPPLIVFTTAYAEYAVEGFRVNAVDYLLKPFGMQDFQRAALRLQERLSAAPAVGASVVASPAVGTPAVSSPAGASAVSSPAVGGSLTAGQSVALQSPADASHDALFLKTDYRIVKVTVSDIRYVEAMSEYLKVWLRSADKPVITLLSMKKMEDRLPGNFMRIHRSYIVNLDDIQEVNKNRVILDADTYLPIGDVYRETFQRYLDTKFLGK